MPNCSFCGILRNSFRLKADDYAVSINPGSWLHAIFLCQVASNRPQRMRSTCPYRTAPDTGYDSVEAVLFRDGGIVNYPEMVVHRDDAIIPVAVIMYERFPFIE
ncbi:hypothetical protein NOF04DRAFT_9273 [Fusarium oxysporum II5]|uniref:Uncharacterized protein n=1 Tax=Fusarium odoratissimum (strain NRRL 54006) TaxID=1089451 RepID=X0JJL7_FUSO5|nr:uncharacterized protein FOIG_10977 [Fusarium odoratissimum NRRL 54006]EXL96601.1 hypothetical protein FOIG_10977 [Fusarium odoratissimum NRRL 54006]KAK2136224.1 hypothetical protein NOF04DRAFT_9273 [Fusarium oxysporum II5]